MAEIPVERKGERREESREDRKDKKSPLIWLLPLLLLIPLIWLLTRAGDERDDGHADLSRDGNVRSDAGTGVAPGSSTSDLTRSDAGAILGDSAGTAQGSAGNADRLTDAGAFFTASDRMSLRGRGIDLSNVEVQRVVSDRGFTVGPRKGQELFVLLDDRLNEGSADKRLRIKPGQRLAIGGTFMDPPSAETKQERYRGLSTKESGELRAQDIYLHAETISQAQ